MRRPEFAADIEEGMSLLRRAALMHVAGVSVGGELVMKTVHGIVVEGSLYFHSSPKGEKTALIDCHVVVQVEEVLAEIPSYFSDPQRACPATTLYRSAQAKGVLRQIDEPVLKAKVLQALMEKFQPEGRHVPIEAQHDLYRAAVKGILVAGLRLDEVTAKVKLAQNKSDSEKHKLMEQLWDRGTKSDLNAIEALRRLNVDVPPPNFLRAPSGTHFTLAPTHDDARAAAALLQGQYWNVDFSADDLVQAHLNSSAWVVLREATGELIGSARAISDFTKSAWIYDVVVTQNRQREGLGGALLTLLLDHPALRRVNKIFLGTRDAQNLYLRHGFQFRSELPNRFNTREMVRFRQ
jgi:predicted FMN-binding regulatory protein PaiB/N-acetylglutamate synthase-like GNAT family acetyltransferase